MVTVNNIYKKPCSNAKNTDNCYLATVNDEKTYARSAARAAGTSTRRVIEGWGHRTQRVMHGWGVLSWRHGTIICQFPVVLAPRRVKPIGYCVHPQAHMSAPHLILTRARRRVCARTVRNWPKKITTNMTSISRKKTPPTHCSIW